MSEDKQEDREALEARLIELEIRSEERRSDLVALQGFVDGYETRIRALEDQVRELLATRDSSVEGPPPASEDLPPHY